MKQKIINSQFSIFNSKGFTLIELSIYMGILAILLLVLTNFFMSALDLQLGSQATSAVEQDSRFILNRLSYDITNADSLTTPANPGNQTNSLTIVKNGTNYTYALNETNLTLTDGSGTNALNSPGSLISNLTFQRIGYTGGKPTVQIKFTITSLAKNKTGQESENFQTTISLR
jgi:prepilin-type N-terminal cleavage/methylation domain-containing protein